MAQRMTKREVLNAIIEMMNEGTLPEGFDREDIVVFAEHEIELIDNRNAKAKEAKAKKAAEPDPFVEAIQNALTDEFQTAADVVAAIGDENLSIAKASFRLNALVESGVAIKDDIKIEGQRTKRKGYKLA